MKLSNDVKKEIEKSAGIVIKDNSLAVKEIMRILRLVKDTRSNCELCKKYNKGILKQCKGVPIKGE